MTEARDTSFTFHPGNTKIYQDLKGCYWVRGMKKDIADFVSQCLTLLDLPVGEGPERAPIKIVTTLECSSMGLGSRVYEFYFKFVKHQARFSCDQGSQPTSFQARLHIKWIDGLSICPRNSMSTWSASLHCIKSRHQVYLTIWKSLLKALETQLKLSTTFHPQMDEQTERLNQILEDILQGCVMDFS